MGEARRIAELIEEHVCSNRMYVYAKCTYVIPCIFNDIEYQVGKRKKLLTELFGKPTIEGYYGPEWHIDFYGPDFNIEGPIVRLDKIVGDIEIR